MTGVQTCALPIFVFVVKPDFTVEQRPVTVAQRANEDVVISKGLEAGETVVTEGQLRLEPGSRVESVDAGAAGQSGGRGRGRRGQ